MEASPGRISRPRRKIMLIADMPSLIGTLGFPIAVCIYLFYDRHKTAQDTRTERINSLRYLEKAIKVDLVNAIDDLKIEIVKLNGRIK